MKTNGPNIFKYTDYRKYLADTFKMARRRDPDFTIRSFSEGLGLAERGHLYQILWGKRNVTPDMGLRITKLLKLKKRDTLYFECLVMWRRASSELVQNEYFKRMCSMNPKLKRMGKKLNKKRRFGRKRK
jgi:uncharacterized protein (TIGR02147 family)